MKETKETDNLKYVGNDFPFWLVLIWIGFSVFFFVYFFSYGWPDLKLWLK